MDKCLKGRTPFCPVSIAMTQEGRKRLCNFSNRYLEVYLQKLSIHNIFLFTPSCLNYTWHTGWEKWYPPSTSCPCVTLCFLEWLLGKSKLKFIYLDTIWVCQSFLILTLMNHPRATYMLFPHLDSWRCWVLLVICFYCFSAYSKEQK